MGENRGWKKGMTHSEESKQKMRQTRRSEDYRARMSETMTGRVRTSEHALKISLARMGPVARQFGKHVAGRLRSLKAGSVKRSLDWALTDDAACVLILSDCVYCGLKSDPKRPNGIDRRENDKGYTVENSVPCCATCNRAKFSLATPEFIAWIQRVAQHQHIVLTTPT